MKPGDFKLTMELVDGKPIITIVIPCNDMVEADQLLTAMKRGIEEILKEDK